MTLSQKTAIVTCGGGAFGAAIARALAAAGARVLVADADADAARATALDIGGLWCAAELASNASLGALAYKAADELGDIDILVNAALPQPQTGAAHLVTEADMDALLLATTRPAFLTLHHFLPAMLARRSGVILNILRSGPGQSVWADAANAWLARATRSLAAEVGPQGVRVNALSILAEATTALPRFLGGSSNGERARQLARVPLGRFALPDDLGQAAVLLCSDAASLMTGQVLDIDGGAGLPH